MRFLPGGPALPDDLLTARDAGQVIFFCGAGVSRAKANLPDFYGLADRVVEKLHVAPDSPARRLIAAAKSQEYIAGIGGLVPADLVFGALEREFPFSEVRAAVAAVLCPAADVDLSAHRIVLDLARDPSGVARLVTTNFDLLFEACDPTLQRRSPPNLPDARRPRDFTSTQTIGIPGVTPSSPETAGVGFASPFLHRRKADPTTRPYSGSSRQIDPASVTAHRYRRRTLVGWLAAKLCTHPD
jgi:hypothetical protein